MHKRSKAHFQLIENSRWHYSEPQLFSASEDEMLNTLLIPCNGSILSCSLFNTQSFFNPLLYSFIAASTPFGAQRCQMNNSLGKRNLFLCHCVLYQQTSSVSTNLFRFEAKTINHISMSCLSRFCDVVGAEKQSCANSITLRSSPILSLAFLLLFFLFAWLNESLNIGGSVETKYTPLFNK